MTTLKCVNMSHSQRYDNLTEIQKMYPKIAKVNYTQNYGMYYIKLSKNVNQRSLLETMFKYVANMHGNE